MEPKTLLGIRLPQLQITTADIARLTDKLLLSAGPARRSKQSAFWVLITLSAIIATAGVMNDSTATVIGAMIVAPLMTPILGAALSVVLADKRLMVQNLALVLAGAATVIAVAMLMGVLTQIELGSDTNSQIASRVAPTLIDLVAALATGVVGAFATVRADVSDTLPGVAIAISLVPPLAVVGLTLQSGQFDEALGALLLFGTNVTAIIATGTAVFLAYGTRKAARAAGVQLGELRRGTVAAVVAVLVLLAVPLGIGRAVVLREELITSQATPVARQWAESQGWQISSVDYSRDTLKIVAIGPPPAIGVDGLRDALDQAGLTTVEAELTEVLGGTEAVTDD
ncbi:MAG: TIGR00341 family protein [Arachnia sp.]